MQAHLEVSHAEQENQAFSLMSRLHVIFRRQNVRVTDIEYMRISPAYCRHILDLAKQSALPDVDQIADRLEQLFFGDKGLFLSTIAATSEKVTAARKSVDGSAAEAATRERLAFKAAAEKTQALEKRPAAAVDSQTLTDYAGPPSEIAYVGRLR